MDRDDTSVTLDSTQHISATHNRFLFGNRLECHRVVGQVVVALGGDDHEILDADAADGGS